MEPGRILDDKYRIEAVIGQGGFGCVYRAEEQLTGETVAIKELVPGFGQDQEMVQRFIQEARATLRLTHPHIARTYTVFEDRGTYYLAMEYLSGGSLADRLDQGPLPVEEAVRITSDLCEALAYAHDKGVVHCDIKPANVLFDEHGEVRLADFGIAHVSADMMTRQLFTATGTAMGTVRYMAPEQLDGVRDDPRIDIYALGTLLYEMLTGVSYLDFETASTPAAQVRNVQRIRSESPRPLRAVRSALPEWLAQVVEQALQKAPQARFATATQLQAALEGGSQTRGASPRSPATAVAPEQRRSTGPRAWLKRLPSAIMVLAGLAGVALLAAVGLWLWRAVGAPRAASEDTLVITSQPTSAASGTRSIPPTASEASDSSGTSRRSEPQPASEATEDTRSPDGDGDGVADAEDRCPDQAGPGGLSGCPDADADGVPDLDDACPADSGLPALNGCPDGDGDGIPDPEDQCPDAVGPTENAGCPVPEPTQVAPTDTPAPTCEVVSGPFSAAWSAVREAIGCATGPAVEGLIAEETFQGGKMFWREPLDYAQAVVLYNNGTWKVYQHAPFVEGSPEFSCPDAETPSRCPPTPKRGFGLIWCDIPEVRDRLGDAIDCERGYQGVMQLFDSGSMLRSDTGAVYVLYDRGDWERR